MKNNIINSILPITFFVLITIIFFNKFIFKGQIPIPSDIPTGMYYPWINNNFGYPVRVPFKNATLTDTVSQFWIWRNWAIDSLKNGKVAIWNPYSLAGYDMSPWFHTIIFQPSNIFYFIFTKTTAMGTVVSSQLLFVLLTTYYYLKYITKSKLASIFGSVIFSLSSYNIGWLTWGTVSFSLACLPLILLFLEKKSYIRLAISVLFCILGGHPQTIFYCLLILFLYYVIKLEYRLNFKIISSVVFGITMASFVLLPSIQIIKDSIRDKDVFINNQNYGFITYADVLISTVSQNYFGNPGTQNYWGTNTMQEKLSGISIIAILLVILYIKSKLHFSKVSKFGIILIILGSLLSTKFPLGWIIYYFKLPLLSTSPASRAMLLVVFGLTLISTESFIYFLKNKYKYKDILESFFMLLLFILTLYFPILYFKYIYSIQDGWIQKFLELDNVNYNTSIRNLTLTAFFSIISLIGLLLTKYKKIFLVILLLTPIIEGLYFGWKYTSFTNPKLYFPTTPSLDFVIKKQQESKDYFRIEREKAEILPPNMWQVYGLSSYSGYDPVYPISYANFLIQNKLTNDYTRYFENDQNTTKYFQDNGLKYLFVINRTKDGVPSPAGEPPYWTKNSNWIKVFQEKNISILENTKYNPPYGLTNKKTQDKINLVKHQDNYWEFNVQNTTSNTFYLIENNSTNWEVKINNKKQNIDSYQGTFKSVKINPGSNHIIFIYHNKLFYIGIIISVASFLSLTIIKYCFIKYDK